MFTAFFGDNGHHFNEGTAVNNNSCFHTKILTRFYVYSNCYVTNSVMECFMQNHVLVFNSRIHSSLSPICYVCVCVCSHMCICKFMDSDVSCFLCVGFSRSACVYLRLQSLPPPHCMSLSQCKNVHVNANVALPCHSLCLFDHPLFKLCSKEPQRNPQ